MWGIRVLGVRKSMWLAPSAFGRARGETWQKCPGLHGWKAAHLASTLSPAEQPQVPCLRVTPQPVSLGGRFFWGGENINDTVSPASAIDCAEAHADAGLY